MQTPPAGLIVKFLLESHSQFPSIFITKFIDEEQLVHIVAEEHK